MCNPDEVAAATRAREHATFELGEDAGANAGRGGATERARTPPPQYAAPPLAA